VWEKQGPECIQPQRKYYSFTRITLAPILILGGFVVEISLFSVRTRRTITMMTPIQGYYPRHVEGLTEFLPVSSTAHMKFTNPPSGFESTPFSDMMEVVIQLAAILAVVVVYYKKIL